jgi:hypothetical protein
VAYDGPMRCFVPLTCLGLMLVLSSLGCGNGSSNGNESGGAGGRGGAGGGMGGGDGGMGGGGGVVRSCMNPNDCVDFGRDPCITSTCTNMVCRFDSLPDGQVCLSDTGLSACLEGTCQLIWPSCGDEGAQDGDFCEPTESIPRLGRCESGACVVNPCEISFDCWDGDPCTSDICEAGDCRHENAPDGTRCGVVVAMECMDGICGGGTGGQGGDGGQGGQDGG